MTCTLGSIQIRATTDWLEELTILDGVASETSCPAGHGLLETTLDQLDDWFARRSYDFTLPLAPATTPRGAGLRQAIAGIGYGDTLSYGALARRVGSSARAIGQACRHNRFPLIIPCHRVVSDSGPQFYSGGGGAATKVWLISFEAETCGTAPAACAAQSSLF